MRIVPSHGGYDRLVSYQKAVVVFDTTTIFCQRFVDRRSRTHDQMIQAARSGKQNIVEGSQASGVSKETEIRLTGVARASLEELLEDYRDFLRTADHELWEKQSSRAQYVRRLGATGGGGRDRFVEFARTRPAPIVANIIICLIHQANYLLDRQIRRLEQDVLRDGGFRERMSAARRRARQVDSR
ncbi:MAG: four helix bundle suffix domain-containing protein [Chloroflexota bacterium]